MYLLALGDFLVVWPASLGERALEGVAEPGAAVRMLLLDSLDREK